MSEQMNTILEMTSSPNDALALRKSPQLAKLAAYFRRYAPRPLEGIPVARCPAVGAERIVGNKRPILPVEATFEGREHHWVRKSSPRSCSSARTCGSPTSS